MDNEVPETELREFAHWINGTWKQGGKLRCLDYVRAQNKAELFYHIYNPFELETRIRSDFENTCHRKALLIKAREFRGFETQISERTVKLHSDNLYARTELLPILGKTPCVISGYPSQQQRMQNVDENFMTCVAMLTAMVYQRVLEQYPEAVFFMTDRWPVAVRIH